MGPGTFGAVLGALEENVNGVIGAWVDGPGDDFFFVVGADESSQILAGLLPIATTGTAKIQPAGDYVAVMNLREQLNS